MWRLGLQNKLGIRPHSVEYNRVYPKADTKFSNILIHPTEYFFRIYSSEGTILPTTMRRVSSIEFKPSVSSTSSSRRTISSQYHSLFLYPSPISFLLCNPFSLCTLCVRKYSPSTKQIFFTGFRKSSFTFCNIFAACGGL